MKKKEPKMKPLNHEEMMLLKGGRVNIPRKPKSPDDSIILI